MSAAARPRRFAHARFISAGAGSGKTYRLTKELEDALVGEGIKPARVIGTTFTVKAAGELRERVRERLIRAGRPQLAEQMAQALIGTVHSVCERLLKRFAFELGLSPELNVVSLEDANGLFNEAVDDVLSAPRVRDLNALADRLGLESWWSDVKAVVDTARNNDIGVDDLPRMGRRNADELLAFFPPVRQDDWDEALLAAVRDALHALLASSDATKTTADYVGKLKTAIFHLRRPPSPWPIWIKLCGAKAAKASEPLADRVRKCAQRFQCHPRFHHDVRTYIEGVFEIASQALQRFQRIKTERGLIDFTDMELLTLRALDDPYVHETLDEELELLLVDEFQDTNPMQLAIFMKLADVADKVVFVGDVKQAIYAFRGCDPDLVFETLEALTKRGSEPAVLEHSWRARPHLVKYTNAVFGRAFAGEIPESQVVLKPKREETTGEAAVLGWSLTGNLAAQAASLADGISRLVASAYRVTDPRTGVPRAVQWGDIAVLAATNDHVEGIARALRAARVPMKMTLRGLLSVPEVCLARACLRRLSDPSDTLATAEILALAEGAEPETWLAERLCWLERGGKSSEWAEGEHPIVAQLAALRGETATQSPVEIVARVLNYIGLRPIVTSWGPSSIQAAQRQRNLDALLDLAVEYEHHCQAQHAAATLTGFLFWLDDPHSPELDLQPVVTSGNAVHALTYHKAKGLEWPVVIATDFHYQWQSRVWGVRVESAASGFDISRPLADRFIRFWPQVFADSKRGIATLDEILASEEAKRCESKGDSENRRVAYVGLTRARDALVLAVPSRSEGRKAWIRTFRSDCLLPSSEKLSLPDGEHIPAAVLDLGAARAALEPQPFTPRWFPQRAGRSAPPREIVQPSLLDPVENVSIGEIVELGERIPVGGTDMAAIGSGVHSVIAAELVNPDAADRLERAARLLQAHGLQDSLDAEYVLEAARRFREWISRRFRPVRVVAECPLTQRLADGRVVRGWIDVLIETEDGWIIVDHKSSPRPRSEWTLEAVEHSGQLAAYRNAVVAAGNPVAGCWLHLPVAGAALRLRF